MDISTLAYSAPQHAELKGNATSWIVYLLKAKTADNPCPETNAMYFIGAAFDSERSGQYD